MHLLSSDLCTSMINLRRGNSYLLLRKKNPFAGNAFRAQSIRFFQGASESFPRDSFHSFNFDPRGATQRVLTSHLFQGAVGVAKRTQVDVRETPSAGWSPVCPASLKVKPTPWPRPIPSEGAHEFLLTETSSVSSFAPNFYVQYRPRGQGWQDGVLPGKIR